LVSTLLLIDLITCLIINYSNFNNHPTRYVSSKFKRNLHYHCHLIPLQQKVIIMHVHFLLPIIFYNTHQMCNHKKNSQKLEPTFLTSLIAYVFSNSSTIDLVNVTFYTYISQDHPNKTKKLTKQISQK
jgi:hypothetical protein